MNTSEMKSDSGQMTATSDSDICLNELLLRMPSGNKDDDANLLAFIVMQCLGRLLYDCAGTSSKCSPEVVALINAHLTGGAFDNAIEDLWMGIADVTDKQSAMEEVAQ
jgi:hypothetical protein